MLRSWAWGAGRETDRAPTAAVIKNNVVADAATVTCREFFIGPVHYVTSERITGLVAQPVDEGLPF